MTDLEYAREFFSKDVYATEVTGIRIDEVRDGYAKVSLAVDRRHVNAVGFVQGGVYLAMADFAFAVASNYDRPLAVTLQSSASFLHGAEGTVLTAEPARGNALRRVGGALCVEEGGHTCVYRVEITDELGTKIFLSTIHGYRLRPRDGRTEEERKADPNPYSRWK